MAATSLGGGRGRTTRVPPAIAQDVTVDTGEWIEQGTEQAFADLDGTK